MFPKRKKKAPLPVVRRTAGQSLREEWDRQVNDNLPFIVFSPLILWAVCIVQWLEEWNRTAPMPRFWTGVAVVATGMAVIAFLRLMPKARNLVRGEKGEVKVAEALEELRAAGYRVFHDLRRDGYNIDHVVVGPAGVFAIETKFRSGYGEIEFRNGEGLFVGGRKEESDSLLQARRNARDVGSMLKDDCKVDRWVKPLVVFVGDWRIKNSWQQTDARVLTPEQVGRYFEQLQPELTRNEIKLIASHLERSAKC
ncbi:MAG: NERD domain-containing protein [Chthoniobacterales bacterium]|nr:NERD domain-containing protein [Chthoniobacterales bacterium]